MIESSRHASKASSDPVEMQAISGGESPSGGDLYKPPPLGFAGNNPPAYDNVAESSSLIQGHREQQQQEQQGSQGSKVTEAEVLKPFSITGKDGVESYMDMRLDRDPDFLEAQVNIWAQKPPVYYMMVHGTHKERRTRRVNGNTRTYTVTITDFDVGVPLHGFLFGEAHPGSTAPLRSLSYIRTAENHECVPRGTVRPTRVSMPNEGEEPTSEALPKPTLQEWCHRYCARFAGHKIFVVERRVHGLDHDRLKANAESIVRSTGYSGNIDVSFVLGRSKIEVLSSNKINQWRRKEWLRFVCYLTFLWIFTWPLLYFFTKRFECVFVEWYFARMRRDGSKEYASLTEDQMLDVWGRSLFDAALNRSNKKLSRQDLPNSQVQINEPFGSHDPRMPPGMGSLDQRYGWGREGWGGHS